MTDNELFGISEQLNDTISRQAAIETPFFDSSAGFMDDGTFQMFSDGAYDAVSRWNRRTDGTAEKTEKTV